MIRLRIEETEIEKRQIIYAAKNQYTFGINIDNLVLSKLVQTKSNSEYLIGFLDKVTRPLVLIMAKMRGYDKTFKVED